MAARTWPIERLRSVGSARPAVDFERIYAEEVKFVWRVLRVFGLSADVADDATQDVFVVVHRRFAEFDGGAVRPWLFTIARGVARNHLRSTTRAERRRAPTPGFATDPHASLVERERLQLAFDILAELDEDKRTAFLLMDVEGFSAPEVAELTGTNVNTVYARRRSARIAFEAALRRRKGEEVER